MYYAVPRNHSQNMPVITATVFKARISALPQPFNAENENCCKFFMKQRLSEDTELCFVTVFGTYREKINPDKQIYKIKIQYNAPLAEKLPKDYYGKTVLMSDLH